MIELPYPAKALNPNKRVHHMARARAAKKHREWAWKATLAAKPAIPAEGPIRLVLTMYPSCRRTRDKDNALASLKSTLDGIADALGVDDSRFDPRIQWDEPVRNPRVVVTVVEDSWTSFGEAAGRVVARAAQELAE